jgi:hypothetical protein
MCMAFCFSPIVQAAPLNLDSTFDHTRTGFILIGVHTTLRCEQCHVDAIFKNTRKDCAGCHSVGSRVGATPKPVNHVPTTSPCDTCHVSATSFQVKSFKHIGISSGCASCHSGRSLGVVSKPVNHFPTLLPCENCHTNTNTFGSWKMDHAGLTSNCASCHGGQFAGVMSKPMAHIATGTADCGVCHNTISFNGARFEHATAAVAGNCGTCHLGQLTGVVSKPAIHISTGSANCDACHTAANTSGYTSFIGGNYNHVTMVSPAAAGNCSTCHTGQFAGVQGKPAYHMLTAAQCDTCHTATNTSNYSTFAGALFNHAAIGTATCTSCHNGVNAKGKTATHISTLADCGTCHTSANTSNYTTFLGATFTHTAIGMATCASCHNGTAALGKPTYHIATTAACDTCHTQANTNNYTTFLGATFTHAAIGTATCASCHNGTSAKGKSATHVATTAACDTCHTQTNTANYTTFLGATYIHPSSPGVCSTCHNGVVAKGKPTTHIVTTAACDLCHTKTNTANYTTFLGATYTHASPPGVCSTCHNGVTALGKPTWHMVTASACDSCHTKANTNNYTSFLGVTGAVDHSAIAAGTCTSCHNGATAKGQSNGHIPVGTLSCDGCHQKYNGTTVTTFAPGTMNHSLVTGSRCDTCHNGSYTTQGALGAQAKVSNHIPTTITGTLDCTTCHNAPNYTSASGWSSEKMNHNGAQGGGSPVYCVTCHLSGTTYLGSMDKKSHNGASTAKDCSSSNCHKPLGKYGIAYSKWN